MRLALLLFLLSAALLRAASLQPAELRTEYRRNPLGVDSPQPRLSWQLAPAGGATSTPRGAHQTAYRILVASSTARPTASRALTPATADLWDSGEIVSAETTLIAYAGKPLRSGQACTWAVSVRDESGQWSPWPTTNVTASTGANTTATATWSMGLLQATDWQGKWIGTGESMRRAPAPATDNTLPDPWFRHRITLAAKPVRAMAYVASVGFHELHVNGRKVGDAVLAPSVTDNSKRARYLAYDLTPYLVAGENVLGLWLGTGWSIFPNFETPDKPRAPIALGQFEVEYADGRTQRIVTDENWKTRPSPSQLIGRWNFRFFGGELYDASREVAGEWSSPALDDTDWKPVVTFTPKLALSADLVEPNRPVTALTGLTITEPRPGEYLVDCGKNFTGWFELKIAGAQPGDRVELAFSERPDQAMTHNLRSAYIVGASGRGVFRNRFNYSTGRWVTIKGLRQKPQPGDVRAELVRSGFDAAPAFSSSNPLLNDIHATTLWTLENLMLGGYIVDCAQRERMGYGGDAHATTTTALYHYPLGAFFNKWAQDWRDVQGNSASWGVGRQAGQLGAGAATDDGNLPYTAPTYWGGGGPAWSGYSVHLPWEMYQFYGDKRLLGESLPTIRRWLAFLESKSSANLLRRWGGEWDFLGDWLWPGASGTNGDTRETLFLNNAYWVYNLDTAARIARVLGETADAIRWEARAREVRAAAHQEFFNAADASYVNGFQAYLAMALLTGVTPDAQRPAVWKRLEDEIRVVRKGHIHAGITGGAFLFKTLMESNRDDLIYTMVNQPDFPGWGHMLKSGATTIWESWEGGNMSLMHSSYLYVGAWFIHGVLGIQPDAAAPGFRRFTIRPGPLDQPGLTWAKGSYNSPHGAIGVEWHQTADAFTLDTTLPPGTTALAYIPAASRDAITEGGRPLAQAAGVKFLRLEGDRAVLELQSGSYALRAAAKR